MGGLSLIVMLVLMGGAIAFFGNHIGRTIGRRRLSLFGLRPKHSSMFMTVVTGITIAGLSLAVLAIASTDVRIALFQMQEIQETLTRTEQSAEEMLRMRDEALAEKNRLEEEVRSAQVALAEALADLESSKVQVAALRQLAQDLEANVDNMETTEAALRRDLTDLTGSYVALEHAMRSGSFVYLRGDIVAAEVLTGSPEPAANEAALMALLARADGAAYDRGARVGGDALPGGELPAEAIELDDRDHLEQALSLLGRDRGQWVVRVAAEQNTVEGEPLLVGIELFPRRLIYREAETIAAREIIPEGGDMDLGLEILDLIEEANHDAIYRGMVTDAGGRALVLNDEALVDAVLLLRRLSGPAAVEAVAAQDAWNTDGPLEIRLVVERAR